jgi:hypothetical protein
MSNEQWVQVQRYPCLLFGLDIAPRLLDNSSGYWGRRPRLFFSAILRKEEVVLMSNSGKPSAVALPPAA